MEPGTRSGHRYPLFIHGYVLLERFITDNFIKFDWNLVLTTESNKTNGGYLQIVCHCSIFGQVSLFVYNSSVVVWVNSSAFWSTMLVSKQTRFSLIIFNKALVIKTMQHEMEVYFIRVKGMCIKFIKDQTQSSGTTY